MNEQIIRGFDFDRQDDILFELQKIDNLEHGLIVRLKGYLDTYNSTYVQRKFNSIIENGYYKIVIDFSQISYISSTGIGTLAQFLKECSKKGGNLVFIRVLSKISEIFRLLGFTQFFVIKDGESEAIEFLRKSQVIPGGFKDGMEHRVVCPNCKKQLNVKKPGKYRCGSCKMALRIDQNDQITLA